MELLTRDNPVFAAYALYSALLAIKMFAVVILTAKQRIKKQIFANPEDAKLHNKAKVKFDDPDIERIRRAHLNDLENIPMFWVVGLLYVLTNPQATVAINLFRLFFVARAIHTFVYAVVVFPQPARGLSFFVGVGVTAYMILHILLHFA
ncbi:microsomal glutathione S-transferase 1-like [Ischnura elegans]|uniref:microsomal glutathione S-transferase 1-like n=1 Tax=Ischnura elegans TaxID=197161 RepID=UPI001ED89B92|nr:microsomal glutathione S-transferase 1-like [Ischnura elegans]